MKENLNSFIGADEDTARPVQTSADFNRVQHADAIDLLNSLPENSVELIITDPPYGIAYHSGHYKDKNPHSPIANDWNFQIADLFAGVDKVLKDKGAFYLFTRWDVYPLWSRAVPPTLKLKNLIVWMKNNWSAGDLEGNFGNHYELIMFIVKEGHKIRGKRWSNIWEFPRIPSEQLRVAAEKPVALIQRAIEASSDEGALVLDPYCGSGSTGEAAVTLNRNFLLADIDKRMVELSCKRLGLPFDENQLRQPIQMSSCPIMDIVPPEPHLWGVHPEDLAAILDKERKP